MDIVLATRNPDKVREIRAILEPLDVTVRTLEEFPEAPEVVEDGETLEDNALKKARAIREFTGVSALADDTGLEVEALDGAPGVYAARYAGIHATYDDNCRKLIGALEGVPADKRVARFRTVMALALVDDDAEVVYKRMKEKEAVPADSEGHPPDALVGVGIIEGRITESKRGTAGFGYDPVFEVPSMGQTLAEMGLEEKNRISHRYRALVETRELLVRWGLASER